MTEILPESPSKSGLILKTAREEMTLTLDQVANELHLRPAVVRAIEEEDYDEFTSDVFLKGYFRTYCRLVNLHEVRMMDLLDQQLLARKKLVEEKNNLITKQQLAKKRKKITVTICVFVVCFLLIAFAYQFATQYSSTTSPDNVSDYETFNDESGLDKTLISNNLELTKTVLENDVSAKNDTTLESNANVDSEQVKIEAQIIQIETESAEGLSDNPEGNNSLSSEYPDPGLVSSAEPLAESSKSTSVDTALDMTVEPMSTLSADSSDTVSMELIIEPTIHATLQATFTGDCWFKVTDVTGKTVIGDLKKADDEISYTGLAPFHVVIGDASKLSLIFEENLVNLKPYTSRNGRAELTLRPSVPNNEG